MRGIGSVPTRWVSFRDSASGSGDARASKRRHSYILQPPAGLRGPGITAGDVPNARVCHFAREPLAPLGAPAGQFAGTGEPSGVDGSGRPSWGSIMLSAPNTADIGRGAPTRPPRAR